ncbi:MAG: hypothetical protein FWE69_08715, partial [Clostridiales bacterium]|nr:hypothetical protein [Clostridiales bacterium]
VAKEGTEGAYTYAICDINGQMLAEDIMPVTQAYGGWPPSRVMLHQSFGWWGRRESFYSRFYIKDGWLYGADFEPLHAVEINAMTPYFSERGDFISNVLYYLEGNRTGGRVFDGQGGYYIQVYADGKLYVKQDDRIYHFPVDSRETYVRNMNDTFVELTMPYQIRLVRNGKEILTASTIQSMSDFYIIADRRIIDKNGVTRYRFQEGEWMRALPGEVVLLYRGPFVGIADLDGNWLVKTLRGED